MADNMKLTSLAFENEGEIPPKYTCNGDDISPPLKFSEVPEGTKSFALIMEDPDAPVGTFDHWIVWDIPADTRLIGEGTEPKGVQGATGFERGGYGGPCPPSGEHRYFFRLYALDTKLDMTEGSNKTDLHNAMRGHILAEATLMGRYSQK